MQTLLLSSPFCGRTVLAHDATMTVEGGRSSYQSTDSDYAFSRPRWLDPQNFALLAQAAVKRDGQRFAAFARKLDDGIQGHALRDLLDMELAEGRPTTGVATTLIAWRAELWPLKAHATRLLRNSGLLPRCAADASSDGSEPEVWRRVDRISRISAQRLRLSFGEGCCVDLVEKLGMPRGRASRLIDLRVGAGYDANQHDFRQGVSILPRSGGVALAAHFSGKLPWDSEAFYRVIFLAPDGRGGHTVADPLRSGLEEDVDIVSKGTLDQKGEWRALLESIDSVEAGKAQQFSGKVYASRPFLVYENPEDVSLEDLLRYFEVEQSLSADLRCRPVT